MNTISNQALFDRVAKHLLTQMKVAKEDSPNGGCQYRTETGLKCAVGCLIDDKEYDPSLEGQGATDTTVVTAIENSMGVKLTFDNQNLLINLQRIHDTVSPEQWEKSLRRLAEVYSIKCDVIEARNCA